METLKAEELTKELVLKLNDKGIVGISSLISCYLIHRWVITQKDEFESDALIFEHPFKLEEEEEIKEQFFKFEDEYKYIYQ